MHSRMEGRIVKSFFFVSLRFCSVQIDFVCDVQHPVNIDTGSHKTYQTLN